MTSTILFQVEIVHPRSWCNFVVVGVKAATRTAAAAAVIFRMRRQFVAMIDRDNLRCDCLKIAPSRFSHKRCYFLRRDINIAAVVVVVVIVIIPVPRSIL